MRLTWDTPGADRTQVGPMNLAISLKWRHNVCDGISNHQPHDCLLNRLFRRRSKKTSKLHVTGLCVGNSLVTGEFPAQMISNAENVSIWWRHHVGGLARLSTKKDVNPLRPRKNVWQFADNILKCHYLNENAWISIKILLKFVSRVQSTIFQHWLRSWLGLDQATSHNLNQGWLAYCCIHVSFSLNGNYNELTHCITAV